MEHSRKFRNIILRAKRHDISSLQILISTGTTMNKSTKKRALESTEKKNEDASAIQFNDWYDISNTKKIRSTTTSAGRQLLEFRKFETTVCLLNQASFSTKRKSKI